MLDLTQSSPRLSALSKSLAAGDSLLVEGLWDPPKALVTALALQATGKHVLILTGAGKEESRLFHDFTYFHKGPVVDFPAWETLPMENIAPSPDIVGERYQVLKAIAGGEPHIIVTSLQACLQRLVSPKVFSSLYLTVNKGMEIGYDLLLSHLTEMGYQRRPVASDKGEFAVRGGIIDIYPVSSPDPFRLEFFGDEVTSIRTYDPIGQKSVATVEKIDITPAQELEFLQNQSSLCSILDYLGPKTIVVFDELLALEDRYASLKAQMEKPNRAFSTMEEFLDGLKGLQTMYWTDTPIEELSEVHHHGAAKEGFYSERSQGAQLSFQMFDRTLQAKKVTHPFRRLGPYLSPEEPNAIDFSGEELLTLLDKHTDTPNQVIFLTSGDAEEVSLKGRLADLHVNLTPPAVFERGYLSSGMAVADAHTLFFPMAELTHRYKMRRQKQRSTYHTPPSEVYELTPGEAVVHLNQGIGKFLGLERRPNHVGIETEFFLVEYAENAKLYVPMQQAHLLSKYIGTSEETPRLHTLGSARWKRTRESTERAIMGYANELLHIYANREVRGGFAFNEDALDLIAFENEFPYVETEDQLQAIDAIKKDMTAPKAMDRLVCGDVGYGKTEVAMRAAFKAVVDGGKQVAVLVPTTVLAMQHFETFCERMSSFPVRVGVLSRFLSAKEIKDTLKGIEEGSIDILIGTHRIVSKDVTFKNLGLVIIDEEQRFGVKAKEHLKKIKTGVDCLTMTATPIPRTLYMSLIGVRDMSVINTPPQDRLPIKTILSEENDEILRTALLRELTRDGQAYVIHNRVESIFECASRIKRLLPQARVVVGHGQMDPDEIDSVFHAFKSGRADILVATTIVENGIDIPNANTILIERADRFGVADLYQLRGRVGRWNRRAYAYFLVPKLHALPELSRKRLGALLESGGYGGGMKIAMRDLEIRGAGDILGLEQSGHVSAVGFHLYCKLLKRTIHALQGKLPTLLVDTKIEIPIDARFPEDYVNEVSLRMELYQRLGETVSWEELDEIWKEIQDRFGPPPAPVKALYHLTRLRVFAARHGITLIKLEKGVLIMEQQIGTTSSTERVPLTLPKHSDAVETLIIPALKKAFKLGQSETTQTTKGTNTT